MVCQSGTPEIEANGEYDAAKKTSCADAHPSLGPTPGQPTKKPMHVPVRLGFVAAAARCRSRSEGENAKGPDEARAGA